VEIDTKKATRSKNRRYFMFDSPQAFLGSGFFLAYCVRAIANSSI
jgi:hypothetical protein